MTFDINFTSSYPSAKRINHSDDYHGTIISDPYRYMEDPNDPDTKKFVKENNILFEYFIDKNLVTKYQETFRKYISYPIYSLPINQSNKYYFIKKDGETPQGHFCSKDVNSDTIIELFDFNTLSEDGTTAPLIFELSPNGHLLACVVSKHGSDWHELLIINLEKKEILESIPWVIFTSIHWHPDNSGIYYSRFPDQSNLQRKGVKLYFHIIGSKVVDDHLIFDPHNEEFSADFSASTDGRWLFISSNKSTMPENKLFIKNISSQDRPLAIISELDNNFYNILDIINNYAYCLTSWDAPNNRLMKFNINNPQKENWVELLPEKNFVLDDAFILNNLILLAYIEDVKHELYLYTFEGKEVTKINLPSIGSIPRDIYSLAIKFITSTNELFLAFNSFFIPPTVYKYNFKNNSVEKFFDNALSFDNDGYIIKQIFYNSKDGTTIPMFLLYKKNITLDGNNKTILYGYGGYNISLYPSYSPRFLSWLDHGGIYAIANLRGGGEYGKKWHFQGILDNKQNVFDDFIAAAEWLIENKYTNSKKLAITGRSNGGLLIGACLIQRPDLFGVAVPEVGVLDMLRFKHFQAGRYWTAEYGDAEKNEEHFKFLIKYSPLHNIDKNSHYPPTLIVTAEADDRVVPMHTKKFTAALQHAQKAKNPILMRIETKAGHGFGKSIQQQIDDNAFVFAFIDQIFRLIDQM